MKIKQNNQKGFTIIEVLIVLAIAGLIMLVVFLAIPSLQRNQRNGGRQTDASRISAAANDFVTNANGTVPSTAAHATTIRTATGTLSNMGTLTSFTGPAAACGAGGAMTASELKICTGATTAAFTATADSVVIATGAQCNGSDQTSAGSARQMAIIYAREPGTGAAWQLACLNV